MISENLFDDSMNSSVASMIPLFDPKVNLSSPYKIIETNSSLERFDKPYEGKVACTLLRRLFLCRWYEWLCSKKCSVSSTPSLRFWPQRGAAQSTERGLIESWTK